MNTYVIACDLGSSQCKTALFDETGNSIALISKEYPSYYPYEGWVEQNPQDWVDACLNSITKLIRNTNVKPSEIAGIGIVGVTHNAVLLDDQHKPLSAAILLYDTRSTLQVRQLCDAWTADYIRERTLNDITTVWTWPQLLWIRDNRPDIWNRIATIVFQKDYVRNQLVDSLCTDIIDAEGSLLFDPVADVWIEEFYNDLGLSQSQLPPAVDPMKIVGGLCASAAKRTGLKEGTPVITGTTDTVAEVLSAGAVELGVATVKLASVGRITFIQENPIRKPHVLNYKHLVDGLWYPGTASKSAAYSFRWLKDLLYSPESNDQKNIYGYMDSLAAQVPVGSGGLLFHPHLMGEWAPHWDNTMKGDFIGLQASHSKGNLIRSVLEGVAFSLLDAFNELDVPYARIKKLLLIGQGSRSPLWSQIIADVFNHPITVPDQMEAVYGAGIITLMGVTAKTISDFYPQLAKGIEYKPIEKNVGHYADMFDIYREADKSLKPIYEKINRL